LRVKGMVTLVADESDNRVKYVQPTALANHYLAQLGQCVEQARQP
jgi:DNA-binding MarR family transcriptional regulator